MTADMDQLAGLLREAASEKVLPRFRSLTSQDVEEKSRGDFVTVADKEAELFLTPRLIDLVPGSIVVGEEATTADPDLLEKAAGEELTWYVDPIDGTALFVAGEPGFAIMVALADKGEVVQSAIYFPVLNEMFLAEKGAGALFVGANSTSYLTARTSPQSLETADAAFYTKHFPGQWAPGLKRLKERVSSYRNEMCAAREYTDIARGAKDLASYHRMLPWDHAPGSLVLSEVGGVARNVETRQDYRPRILQGPHILAANEELWQAARKVLL
ncbi:MAG: inositol monophosphatase [Rhodobiaceae bacterium]|nr:inositol monophosphatase [Rhodobiaceae bacterium]